MRDGDEFVTEIRDRLGQAQDIMKVNYDRSHRDLHFQVGDWVWLRLNHRSAVGINDGGNSKLAPRYFGPYQVTERIGAV